MELRIYTEDQHYHLIEEWAFCVAQVPPPAVILPVGVIAMEGNVEIGRASCRERV